MNVAIIGYATEGKVSADYFSLAGHSVTICDQDENLEIPGKFSKQLGVSYLNDLSRFDLIVRSAGIKPAVILKDNPDITGKITTAVNEFMRQAPTKNIIGVTGTKGKGTTSTLISKLIEASGKKVHLGGNIGRSPLDFIKEVSASDWVVLELSSFQLSDFFGPSPHIAVCLMVVSEHLDWHRDFEDYLDAKMNLFRYQNPEDIAIYFSDNEISRQVVYESPAEEKVNYYNLPGAHVFNNTIMIDGYNICAVSELGLRGPHNWQNVCAAVTAVWRAGFKDIETIKGVITSFKGLEHRLELVREVDSVMYIDDSFGTTPETAIVALEAFRQPKVIILGGSDKGASYDELAEAVVKNAVRKVVLIGEQANRIRASLDKAGYSSYVDGGETMQEIVRACQSVAEPGDVVLLSTACASFDMFKNYKDRAAQFVRAVRSL